MSRDRNGRAHQEAGAPHAAGGQFSHDPTPDPAASFDAATDPRPMLARVYDDEYLMAGYAPAPGLILMALDDEAQVGHAGDDEADAFLQHAREHDYYDTLAAIAAVDEPFAQERWQEKMSAVADALRIADPEPDLIGGGRGEEGYMGGSKFTGSMYEASKSMPQTEINKLVRKDLTFAKDAGYLPQAASFRVTKERGLTSINVTVSGIPKDLIWHPGNPYDADDHRPHGRTEYGRELEARIAHVADAYGQSDVNSQVDYFNSYRAARITFDWGDTA